MSCSRLCDNGVRGKRVKHTAHGTHTMRGLLMVAGICACGLRPAAATFGDKEGVASRLSDAAPLTVPTSGACAEPSNFYTFEASPRCLARACGDLQNRPPCMTLLRNQLAAVRTAGPPRCAQGGGGLRRLHMYWNGPLLRSTRLSLMSIGATQTCARLTVWYGEKGDPSATTLIRAPTLLSCSGSKPDCSP